MVIYKKTKQILLKLAEIKRKIDFDCLNIGHLKSSASHSRVKTYDTLEFLWLNIVLNSLKIIHIREKINFLEVLQSSKNKKNMLIFYKFIGIKDFNTNIPSIGFFSDYVNYFDQTELENLLNQALTLIRHLKINNTEWSLISIDGKEIRNCSDSNKKSINIVRNKILTHSFLVDHEMTWIKNNLIEFIENNFTKNDVFIGDGIYHNTKIRRFFSQNGYKAILPMKTLTKLFRKRLNTVINLNHNKGKFLTTYNKRNKHVIEEQITLIPTQTKLYKELNQWKYIIKIQTNSTNIKTNKLTVKTRSFLTNLDLSNTLETLKSLRNLINQHWQVETFHQYKDYNFLEDKYFKSRLKSGFKSIINNFSYILHQGCNFNNKHKIDSFKNSLLLLIGIFIYFLAEQH